MRRFVWRLQRVLEIRRKQEQVKRAELFKLTEKLAQARGELLIRKKVLEDIIAGLSGKNPQRRLGEQEFFLKCSATNDEQIKRIKKEINELELQQREKIIEVLRLKRFKEGLEKLRTQAKRQFISAEEKLEQKEMDEEATVLFARKNLEMVVD